MGLSENSVPLHQLVLLIIIPTKWLFHWGYTLFSDKPKWCIEHHRNSSNDSSGWWFGTCFFFVPYIGNSNHQLTSIFFRGAETINQRVTHVVALLKTAILACQDIPQVYQRLAFRDSIFQLKKKHKMKILHQWILT